MTSSYTEAQVETQSAAKILDNFVDHLKRDHDMTMQVDDDGVRYIEHNAFRVDFHVSDVSIRFAIKAPNPAALGFFKEEIAEHVAEVDENAARNLRWTGEMAKVGALPPNFHVLTVRNRVELHRNLVRVTLAFPGFSDHMGDGIHLRLMMPQSVHRLPVWPTMAANGTPVWPKGDDLLHVRFVTVSAFDPANDEVSLDIVSHGDGLISKWAGCAKRGEQVGAMGPAGINALPPADRYLICVDMTGLGSLTRLLKTIPDTAVGDILVCCPHDFRLSDYLPPMTGFEIQSAPENDPEILMKQLQELMNQKQPGFGFFAGEFGCAQAARTFFKQDLGLGKDKQLSVAYWREGHPGYGS
ncbi:MAG: siderophore-interacting protein [Pseudomonadota bacterium]